MANDDCKHEQWTEYEVSEGDYIVTHRVCRDCGAEL